MKRVLYRKNINLAIGEYRPSLPNPSDAMRGVKDARFPTGCFNILVPEAERRHNHLGVISCTHLMLPIA